MGHRLTKIYTRTGDDGTTGLSDGRRIEKDSVRIEAIGTVDELNSIIGMVLAHDLPQVIQSCLTDVQHHLFDLGGELSIPNIKTITAQQITRLENILDELNAPLPPLKEFILPAGGIATSTCHLARTVCRRAERRLITLARDEEINPLSVAYLNRLSDLLFVMARSLAHHEHGSEVFWQHNRTE